MKRLLLTLFICPVLCSAFGQQETMPVELIYFNYQLTGLAVLLSWGTATEVNNYGFNVERNSGSLWQTITFVMGSGTSNSPKYYSFYDTTVASGKTYLYRLKQIDNDGSYKYSDTLVVSIISGIKKNKNIPPLNFSVSQNFPNPFNPVTNIKLELPQSAEIIFRVYNIAGQLVFEDHYANVLPGSYTISFDGSGLSSGVYYYYVTAGRYSQAKLMVLLK